MYSEYDFNWEKLERTINEFHPEESNSIYEIITSHTSKQAKFTKFIKNLNDLYAEDEMRVRRTMREFLSSSKKTARSKKLSIHLYCDPINIVRDLLNLTFQLGEENADDASISNVTITTNAYSVGVDRIIEGTKLLYPMYPFNPPQSLVLGMSSVILYVGLVFKGVLLKDKKYLEDFFRNKALFVSFSWGPEMFFSMANLRSNSLIIAPSISV